MLVNGVIGPVKADTMACDPKELLMSAFQHISPAQVAKMLETRAIQIVDVRDNQSFAWNHMPGALHLTNTNVSDFVLNGEFDQPVVVCCFHGISSQSAAEYLANQGFEEVYSLDGGFEAWEKEFPKLTERGT